MSFICIFLLFCLFLCLKSIECIGEKSSGFGYLTHKLHENATAASFIPKTHWVCETDPELEKLVHTVGSRTKMFMFYHDDLTERVAQKYANCKDWVFPIRLATSPFFESIAYKTFFLQNLAIYGKNTDLFITCTYRHAQEFVPAWPQVNTLTYERLKEFISTTVSNRYDVYPLETWPSHTLFESLGRYHQRPAVRAWRGLLQKMGFREDEIDTYTDINAFWRSSYIIRPDMMRKMTFLMTKAMELVEHDATIRYLFSKDSTYRGGNAQIAMHTFGTPYYQMHPFIFERLPSFFLSEMNASAPNLRSVNFSHPHRPLSPIIEWPCLIDDSLETFVHSNGTRVQLFVFYEINRTETRQAAMQFAHCKDWVIPIAIHDPTCMDGEALLFALKHAALRLLVTTDWVLTLHVDQVARLQSDRTIETLLSTALIKERVLQARQQHLDLIYWNAVATQATPLMDMQSVPEEMASRWNLFLESMRFSPSEIATATHLFMLVHTPRDRVSFLATPMTVSRLAAAMTAVREHWRSRPVTTSSTPPTTGTTRLLASTSTSNSNTAMNGGNNGGSNTPKISFCQWWQQETFHLSRLPFYFLAAMNAHVPQLQAPSFERPSSWSTSFSSLVSAHPVCEEIGSRIVDLLVGSRGTKTLFFMGYDYFMESQALRLAYCLDWVIPVRMPTLLTPYLSTQILEEVRLRIAQDMSVRFKYEQADLILIGFADMLQPFGKRYHPFSSTLSYSSSTVSSSSSMSAATSRPLRWSKLREMLMLSQTYQFIPVESTVQYSSLFSLGAWKALLKMMQYSEKEIACSEAVQSFGRSSFLANKATWELLSSKLTAARMILQNQTAATLATFRKPADMSVLWKEGGSDWILTDALGAAYFPLEAAIFERLPSFFLAMKNATAAPHLVTANFQCK